MAKLTSTRSTRGPHRSKSSSQPKPSRPPQEHSTHRQKRRKQIIRFAAGRVKHQQWASIARQTAAIALGDGKYVENLRCSVPAVSSSPIADSPETSQLQRSLSTWHVVHDISSQVRYSNRATVFYPRDSDAVRSWVTRPAASLLVAPRRTAIEFSKYSAVNRSRRLYLDSVASQKTTPYPIRQTTIGVLTSASVHRPGGAYLSGGTEPDAVLARSTSLVASLSTPEARQFYSEMKKYTKEYGAGFFPHSLVYSPSIVGFRRDDDDHFNVQDDDFDPELDAIPADPTTAELELPPAVNAQNQRAMGEYVSPYLMNVVSAVPVNANTIRTASSPPPFPSNDSTSFSPTSTETVEATIRQTVKDRLGRALRLFELHGDRKLVLGAFGCREGLSVEVVAQIYAELLACNVGENGDGRFRDVFEKVVFSLPGKLCAPFRTAFQMRVFDDELNRALDAVEL